MPAAVSPQKFVRAKVCLVGQREAIGHPVSQVNVGQIATMRFIDQREDVPGAQAAAVMVGIVDEVNCRQTEGRASTIPTPTSVPSRYKHHSSVGNGLETNDW